MPWLRALPDVQDEATTLRPWRVDAIQSARVPIWVEPRVNRLVPSSEGRAFFFENRRLTIKSQEGGRKKSSKRGGMELGNIVVVLLSIKDDVAKILDKSVNVFAKETKVDDESERAAEALAVF